MSRMHECSQVIHSTVEVLLRQITNTLLYNGILYTGLERWVILANKHYSDEAVRGWREGMRGMKEGEAEGERGD